jgi:hypothetical protein
MRVVVLKAKMTVSDGTWYEPSRPSSAGGSSPGHTHLIGQKH